MYCNYIIERKCLEDRKKHHKNQLQNVKPMIDNRNPYTPSFFDHKKRNMLAVKRMFNNINRKK